MRVSTQILKNNNAGIILEQIFLEFCKRVTSAIQKAQSSDQKAALICGDCDNLGAATLIYYLIDQFKMPYTQAYGHIKERRATVQLIDL